MKSKDNELMDGFLFTDQYELTMAQLYFRAGLHEVPAQFDHFFRKYPDYGGHQAGYCINAGLQWLVDWMQRTRVRPEEIEQLKTIKGRTGARVFDDAFLEWLGREGCFDGLSLEAVPEGRVVHPNEPITVVRGPLAMAQIFESVLLNRLNYQTLVATKAARIRDVAGDGLVVDFGMRRAQDRAANAAARAAMIGGADFTSNTGVSLALGFPPKGTHAHSLVQAFMAIGAGEEEAFRHYADVYPDDCILLVDTVNTLESGIPNAIRVFEELRKKGHEPVGIRLDSGDLAYLAVEAAKQLNEAGFSDCTIVLSNQLDERTIQQILSQIRQESSRSGMDADAIIKRLAYGVGTHLVTSSGSPALDGVYKLVGLKKEGEWRPAIKISENPAKIPNPGSKSLYRLYDQRGLATADLMCRQEEDPGTEDSLALHHAIDLSMHRTVRTDSISSMERLLVPIISEGRLQTELPDIADIRKRRKKDIDRLDSGVRRIINPHVYHVSISEKLRTLKQDLIAAAEK